MHAQSAKRCANITMGSSPETMSAFQVYTKHCHKMSRTKVAMLSIFTWFYFLCVPTLILGTTDVSQLVRPTGRVSLFSFERGHLRSVTEGVDTEVVLTAAPRYFEAYLFECNATFPVQWAYIGEGAPVVTADVGRFFRDFYDVNTYTYQSILLMYSLQELQSGRYICRGASKEHDKLAIHYDVFVPGNSTQILLSTSEKKLFIPETKEHAYIPCGVSDSTAVVNLYRGNQWGTFYPVPVNGSITFNPRKGFKIRFKDFLDPWGTYLCVSESNKKRRKVHLIPESLKAKYDMINHVNGKIPVYFSYEYEYNRVLCCTGTNFIPKLQWAGCGSILDCQVKSACFEEDRCEQRLGNSGYNPTKWIDPGPLPPGCSGYRLRDDQNGDFGLFKCSTPGIAQYQPYLLNRGNIFLDFEKTPPSEMILTLQRISPEGPSFVGDDLEFHCNSTRFYFAFGIRWGWEKVNGEIDFIDDSTVVRDKYSIKGHRRRTTLKIPYADVKSIICFVPVVNSATEWRTVSLPLVIASTDVNFISHQSPVPNNVIDLDSITYQTDYDAANPDPPQQNVVNQQPQQNQYQNPPQQTNLQVYNSAKTPYQEIQGVVPPSSVEQQQHQKNPNYYSYTHESSGEAIHQPHQQSIPETHHHQLNGNDIQSHQSRVHPIAQPHIVDIHSASPHVQASTPSPNIISISRSKKNRNRSGGSSSSSGIPTTIRSNRRTVPNIKPDVQYDTYDRDYGSPYDTFEPRPSSSSKSNTRHHNSRHHHPQQRQEIEASSSKIPYQQQTSSNTHTSKRPSSSTTSSSRRHNYSRNEILYTTPKKSYRDYNNYNTKTEFGVDMRLSLPFEPAIPSRSRYAHGSNYSTIPSRLSSSTSTSSRSSGSPSRNQSGRSHSRRPTSLHSQSSSRPLSRHDQHDHRHNTNQQEKDYTIDDSYSQHIRLSLPAKSISTQLPNLEKVARNRGRTHQTSHSGHGRGRSHTSATRDEISTGNPSIRHNTDYYYTDDSPVEIKVPHTKAHDPYISSHHRSRARQDLRHPQESYGTREPSKNNLYRDPDHIEPELHESSSPTTYYKKRPHSLDDHHHTYSQTTTSQQPFNYRHDHATHPSHDNINTAATSSRHSPRPHLSLQPSQSQHQEIHQDQQAKYLDPVPAHRENYRSSGRHRSRSRGMKFDTDGDTAAEGGAIIDAFEFTSPTARPAYLVSTPNQLQQNSNELINADMELKRVRPNIRTRTSPRPLVKTVTSNVTPKNSSDILHSVSISISSRISHGGENGNAHNDDQLLVPVSGEHVVDSSLAEKPHNEIQETEDYDIYSPQYTNYKMSTIPPTVKPVVPIQFFHVKPTEISSFQPAKTIIDEEDEYDIG